MSATEFRIGNIVGKFFNREIGYIPSEVRGIAKDTIYFDDEGEEKFRDKSDLTSLEGIPLTEEWLIRLGFKCVHEKNKHYNIVNPKGYKDNYTINFVPTLNEQWTLCFHDLTVNQSYITCTHIKYVHRLQNLCFALTGEELSIK